MTSSTLARLLTITQGETFNPHGMKLTLLAKLGETVFRHGRPVPPTSPAACKGAVCQLTCARLLQVMSCAHPSAVGLAVESLLGACTQVRLICQAYKRQ